jgi:predicted ATPase/DNA-binding CsgD family transcriptional regulator
MVRDSSRPVGNLREQLTSLVGRRAELAEVRRLLSGSRLVTLVGPGGVGKTRLALHVGRTTRAAFRDGVWLVALEDVTEPALLVSTVLSTLGEPVHTGSSMASVADHLRDRQVLLILDNCEHLIEACAKLVTELLPRCPNLRVVATSRELLRISGETVFSVPPLTLPEPGQLLRPGAADAFDAVALFLDRATAVNPGFSLEDDDEQAVATLCRSLDGLPLAIELAAAGTRVLPIQALCKWAAERAEVPVSGGRNVASRQRTLHATIEYSYWLCSGDARTVWSRMSVFRGGADLEAIEVVCHDRALRPDQILRALAELIDKSIVSFDGARYHMLHMIRQFGLRRLCLAGEDDAVSRAHRDYYAGFAQEVDAGWFGPDQPALFGRALADLANVRAALEFCLAERSESGVGLRMASALWMFWAGCGLIGEGRHWLDRLMVADDPGNPKRAIALWVNGFLTALDGDPPAALALLDECHRLAIRVRSDADIAHALGYRGVAELLQNRTEEAIADLEEAVRREKKLPAFDPVLVSLLLNLGVALCFQDRLHHAVEVLEETRSLCAAHGEQLVLSWSLLFLGLAALIERRVPRAVELLNDGLRRKRALEDKLGIVFAVEFLSWAALADHDAGRAARLLAASEAISKPVDPHLAGFRRLLQWRVHYVQQARETLGPRAFEAATQCGRHFSRTEAVDYALGENTAPAGTSTDSLADLPLTSREREIAQLVATGRTNREIAVELTIARRTVDTHVEHILAKMNFTSRTQIAALFAVVAKGDR